MRAMTVGRLMKTLLDYPMDAEVYVMDSEIPGYEKPQELMVVDATYTPAAHPTSVYLRVEIDG